MTTNRIIAGLVMLVLLLVAGGLAIKLARRLPIAPTGAAALQPPLDVIDSAFYRKTSEFDPGTIRVYIRNTGKQDLGFKEVLLDGLPIPVSGIEPEQKARAPEKAPALQPGAKANDLCATAMKECAAGRVIWARLAPPIGTPGSISEFSAKLANPAARPMKLEFVPRSGTDRISVMVRPQTPAIAISATAFSPALDVTYVYIKGCSAEPTKITGLEVDGKRPARKARLTGQTVRQGETALAVVHLDKPATPGQWLTIKVSGEDGMGAEERVRVFSGFPISTEVGNSVPVGFGLDPTPYSSQPAYLTEDEPKAPAVAAGESGLRGNYIFFCPMHTYGADKTLSASEILGRYDLCSRFDPSHPSFIHLCRIRPETGCALFGETADAIRLNPGVTSGLSQGKPGEALEETVARLMSYACLGASPRPVFGLADTERFPSDTRTLASPGELRRRVYTMLGFGIRGLFYRHGAWTQDTPAATGMNDEIRRINREVSAVRDLLAIAAPLPQVTTPGRHDYLPYALLAGDKAVLVSVVRKTGKQVPTPTSPETAMVLKLQIPGAFVLGTPARVTPQGLVADGALSSENGTSSLRITAPADAAIWAIPVKQ